MIGATMQEEGRGWGWGCEKRKIAPLAEPEAGIHHSDTYWVINTSAMRGPEEEQEREECSERSKEESWQSWYETEGKGGSQKPLCWPSESLHKEQENRRSLWRLQAICVIYEALWGIDGWSAKAQREKCSTVLYIYRLNTGTLAQRESLTVLGAQWWGCGSRPELPVS